MAKTPALIKAFTEDISWILARLIHDKLFHLDINPSDQSCPSWSSYNTRHDSPSKYMSIVGYCPMLDACSTEPSTVYTVMKQLQHMMSIMKPRHSVITVDLAIYRVAKKYNNPGWRFHIITNFPRALETMHNSSGLKQIIAEVFSDVTTRSIMAGKHYNRGIMLHMHMKLFIVKSFLR